MNRKFLFTGRKILLVEDELVVAEKASQQLIALGFEEVFIATTLSQAYDTLARDRIDAALLDVNLLGDETTVELGWSLAADGVPIVFFSGFNADEMVRLTRGHEFMEKPISLSRLKAALHRAALRIPSHAQQIQNKKMAGQTARR